MAKMFEYYCRRDFPHECRNIFRSPTKLRDNHAQCPVCGSYKLSCKEVEVSEYKDGKDGHRR